MGAENMYSMLPSRIYYLRIFIKQQVGKERAAILELQTRNSGQPRQQFLWALKTNLKDLNVQEYEGLID